MRVYAENSRLRLILIERFALNDHIIRMDPNEWLHCDNSLIAISTPTNALLCNLLRMSISHVERGMRIAILKEEWNEGEEEKIDRFIRGEYSRIQREIQEETKSVMSLGEGNWKEERIEQLNTNRTIPMIQYSTFTVSPTAKDEINRYLNHISCPDENSEEKTHKPPNLHWTPSVLDGDLEITLRLRFFISLPDRQIVSTLAREAQSYFSSVYEWSEGLLLSNDTAKIHVQRVNDNTLNISGRTCYEETEEVSSASSLLWPMISFAAKGIIHSHSNNQFHCDLVLIGSPLFVGTIDNRVFELISFMNTANRCGKIGFKYRGEVEMVNLHNLFPNGVPRSLSDLLSSWTSLSSLSLPPPSPNPSSISLTIPHSHSRGRRVSFGAIRTLGAPSSSVDQYVDSLINQTLQQAIHS